MGAPGRVRSPARSGTWPGGLAASTCWCRPRACHRSGHHRFGHGHLGQGRDPCDHPGAIGVIVVQGGNGAKAVATPGIAVVSTKKPLKQGQGLHHPDPAHQARSRAGALTGKAYGLSPPAPPRPAPRRWRSHSNRSPPPPSRRCVPRRAGKEGNIIQAVGNFSAYTNKKAPIVAVLKFFYGLSVPKGTVYFLKPNGKTVDKLPACRRAPPGTTPRASTGQSRSSAQPPTTASTPRTPSTSPATTRRWGGAKGSKAGGWFLSPARRRLSPGSACRGLTDLEPALIRVIHSTRLTWLSAGKMGHY